MVHNDTDLVSKINITYMHNVPCATSGTLSARATWFLYFMKSQTWALALFSRFALCSTLILIPWISIAHFADFQVRSSLNRSQKDQWFAPKKTVVSSRSQAVNRLLHCTLGWYS